MYNESIKRRFIRDQIKTPSRIRACEAVFEAIEPYEVEWGADYCTRSIEELEPVLEELVGMRARSRLNRLIVLRGYARWCYDTKIVPDATENIFKIESLGLSKVKSMTVKNPVHLQRCMDEVFEPESEEMVDNTYRCYYWLAYAGMPEDEILDVRCSDVDLISETVTYNGKIYMIYHEGLAAFKNAATLASFIYKNRNYTEAKKKISRFRADGDQLVRGFRASPTQFAMRAELSKRSKRALDEGRTETKLSYNRVQLSGLFFRMYELECRGMPVDFSQAADEFMKASVERRNAPYNLESGRNTLDAKKRQIERDYLLDYERWKVAWSIY